MSFLSEPGISTMDREFQVSAASVVVTRHTLDVALVDGRTVSVPLWWYPRLFVATRAERANYEILPGGFGIRWPGLDEDIGVWALLAGGPASGATPPSEKAVAG